MTTRRINFFAGAGCGKTTIAAKLFAEMKYMEFDIEIVPEYIKTWAYENKHPQSYDQLYIFAKQLRAEDTFLRNVDYVVTDSPIMLNTAYSKLYNFEVTDYLIKIAQQFDRDFPSLNFFIERTVNYVDKGRYHTHQEAVDFDNFLLDFLDQNLKRKLIKIRIDEFDNLLDLVLGDLKSY